MLLQTTTELENNQGIPLLGRGKGRQAWGGLSHRNKPTQALRDRRRSAPPPPRKAFSEEFVLLIDLRT
jgi:hypothetical protein